MRRSQVLYTPNLRAVVGLNSEFCHSLTFVRLQVTSDTVPGMSRNLRLTVVQPDDKIALVASRLTRE